MGLAAVGAYKLGGFLPLKPIFDLSLRIGRAVSGGETTPMVPENPFQVLR
jgi:hypothetical protein